MVRILLVTLAPLLTGAAFALHEHAGRIASLGGSQQREVRLVPQPSEWVPFSADSRRIHETDGRVFVGRDYRSSDGSTRNETGPETVGINSIAIKNIPQATFYLWTSKTGWTSQPMEMPPWGWKPIPRTFDSSILPVAETAEGFHLLRYVTQGRTFYQAPSLNLFTLITRVPCQFDPSAQCGTWYSNIQVGEQPAELFTPSLAAAIVHRSEPGGIIERMAPQRKP